MFGYQVADLQSDLNVVGGNITGTLHKQTTGDLVTTYGEGMSVFQGAKQVKKAPKKEPKKKD